eukprot:m.279423 g.279423  ORF g.279423 m.279423 type:complete len:127 (+) comp15743_c0_seq2:3774-4154(+)
MRVINSCCLSCACALLLSFLLSSVLEFCCDPSFVFCDCVSTCRCPSSTPMLINFQSVYQHCAEVVGDVLVILDIHAAPMTTPVELPIFHEQPQEGAHQILRLLERRKSDSEARNFVKRNKTSLASR